MARGDYMIGRATQVGWALQAVASGTSWDGTPGTARYFKPVAGSANIAFAADQNLDETMDVDAESVTTGATKISGSFEVLMSYEHQELLAIGAYGGDDSNAGSGPYTHTIALADQLKYLTIYYYYENFKGGDFLRTVTNCVITNSTLSGESEGRPKFMVSWAGQSLVESIPGTAPTLNMPDLVDWKDLTVTLNSVEACANSTTFSMDNPVDDSDVGMCSDAPNVNTLFRSGQRTKQLTVELGMDDTIEDFLDAPSTAISGSLVWNNGGAGAAEREINIPITAMYINQHDTNIATWGKRRESINFTILTLGDIVFTNSLSAQQL